MSEPVDEVHQALSNAVRTAVLAAGQVAEIIAARRAETYRRAQHASETEARHTAARLRAERQAATPVMRQTWNDKWWRTATPERIADTYQVAAGWAVDGDPYAQATAHRMREQIQTRYGVTIPPSRIAPRELAQLLTEPETHHQSVGREGADAAAQPAVEEGTGQTAAVRAAPHGMLDEHWWSGATAEEIGGVWAHVAAWPEGDTRTTMTTLLLENIQRRYGPEFDASASTAEVTAAVKSALADQLREKARDEDGAAETAQDTAARLDNTAPAAATAEVAHGKRMRVAAEQDQAAAAALENLTDQEAATAVRTAAEAFPRTPAARLAQAGQRTRGTARRPRSPGQQRHHERGR